MSSRWIARLLQKRLLIGGILLALVLLAVAAWPGSVAVDVAPVQEGALQVTVDEEGETRVRDRFVVSAPVSGRVLRVELEVAIGVLVDAASQECEKNVDAFTCDFLDLGVIIERQALKVPPSLNLVVDPLPVRQRG